jgi:hypothetical protein
VVVATTTTQHNKFMIKTNLILTTEIDSGFIPFQKEHNNEIHSMLHHVIITHKAT